MLKNHRALMAYLLIMSSIMLHGQSIMINLPTNPPPNISDWATGASPFTINISGTAALGESRMLVFIRSSSGQVVCGTNQPSMAQPTDIKAGAPRVWAGQSAIALLGDDCMLPVGSYEICVQIFGIRNREDAKPDSERCLPFEIRDMECSPPNNVAPRDKQRFSSADILKPITFSWSPFVMQGRKLITYNLMVWEIEDGQTLYEALYNNMPSITENIKNRTNYIVTPGLIEKRNATYVWRVTAVDEEGSPLCNNAQSEPTIFKIELPEETPAITEDDDSTRSTEKDCCANDIIDKGNNVKISSANVAELEQKFNISSSNIRKVSVEIISITESMSGDCDDCSEHERWIYKFISHNTTSWNNEAAMNASPVNGSSYYPANLIEWLCDKQGDVTLNLRFAIPDKQSVCSREIAICLRYKFVDKDCNVCEEIVCYELKN